MNTHIMIDLETMGSTPNGAIAQIGYAVFDADDADADIIEARSLNVDIASSMKAGMPLDASTIKWWLEQSEAARKGLFDPKPMTLMNAIGALGEAYRLHKPVATWAYPTSFDIAILEAAHKYIGFEVPWHYRTVRDARTLIAQVIDRSELDGLSVSGATVHDGRNDCINQIRWLMEAKRRLKIEVLK